AYAATSTVMLEISQQLVLIVATHTDRSDLDFATRRSHQHFFPTRRSSDLILRGQIRVAATHHGGNLVQLAQILVVIERVVGQAKSEEHTSELQSRENLVCRLLLEKQNHHLGNQADDGPENGRAPV